MLSYLYLETITGCRCKRRVRSRFFERQSRWSSRESPAFVCAPQAVTPLAIALTVVQQLVFPIVSGVRPVVACVNQPRTSPSYSTMHLFLAKKVAVSEGAPLSVIAWDPVYDLIAVGGGGGLLKVGTPQGREGVKRGDTTRHPPPPPTPIRRSSNSTCPPPPVTPPPAASRPPSPCPPTRSSPGTRTAPPLPPSPGRAPAAASPRATRRAWCCTGGKRTGGG